MSVVTIKVLTFTNSFDGLFFPQLTYGNNELTWSYLLVVLVSSHMRKKCQNTPIPDLKPPAHALLKSAEEQEGGKNKQTSFIATPLQTKYCLMQGFSLYLWFSHFYTMGSSLSPMKYFCWGSCKLILQFLNIFLQVGKASFQLLHPSLRLQQSSFYHARKIRQENTWKAFSLFLLDFSGMNLNWIHLPSGVHKNFVLLHYSHQSLSEYERVTSAFISCPSPYPMRAWKAFIYTCFVAYIIKKKKKQTGQILQA